MYVRVGGIIDDDDGGGGGVTNVWQPEARRDRRADFQAAAQISGPRRARQARAKEPLKAAKVSVGRSGRSASYSSDKAGGGNNPSTLPTLSAISTSKARAA